MNTMNALLDEIGIANAEDLAELDHDQLLLIKGLLKQIPQKSFQEALCL